MWRGLFATLLVAVFGGLLAVSGTARPRDGGVPAAASFRLPDGSAGCTYSDGRIACRTERRHDAAVLAADGSIVISDEAVAWDAETTVLRPTESWWHAGFTCRRLGRNLVCTTTNGGTIAVPVGRG